MAASNTGNSEQSCQAVDRNEVMVGLIAALIVKTNTWLGSLNPHHDFDAMVELKEEVDEIWQDLLDQTIPDSEEDGSEESTAEITESEEEEPPLTPLQRRNAMDYPPPNQRDNKRQRGN